MPETTCVVGIDELYTEFKRVLDKLGFSESRSSLCARIFADNTRDGVLSHGVNRFPGFVDFVRRGIVDIHAEPSMIHAAGAFERWNGNRGPGPLNADFCMGRAISLAHEHTVGVVALRNTNHWMRGGSYGLQAADAGCIGVCWTNTTALMPPWGGSTPRLGNNPLVVCVPNPPDHVLLDMSMSQFSFGRMEMAHRAGEKLPVPGGFDEHGELTNEPGDILHSRRPLPIGYWKGSGLALVLDCVVSALSCGDATFQIAQREDETGVSQLFVAIDPHRAGVAEPTGGIIRNIIEDLHSPDIQDDPRNAVAYPGQRTAERRRKHLDKGVVVEAALWNSIRAM